MLRGRVLPLAHPSRSWPPSTRDAAYVVSVIIWGRHVTTHSRQTCLAKPEMPTTVGNHDFIVRREVFEMTPPAITRRLTVSDAQVLHEDDDLAIERERALADCLFVRPSRLRFAR